MVAAHTDGERATRGTAVTLRERIVSAMVGATLVSVVVTPLDVVKVRMQAQRDSYVFCGHLFDQVNAVCRQCLVSGQGNGTMTGTVPSILKIARTEGIKSLYRGFFPTIVMSVPATVVYFVGYESLKELLLVSHLGVADQQFDGQFHGDNNKSKSSLWVPAVCGPTARIFAASVIAPMELVKTRMQHDSKTLGAQTMHLWRTVSNGGFTLLFRGLVPTLWRDVPFSGIYWTVYELLKRELHSSNDGTPNQVFLSSFISGAMAGSLAATLTVPFDVVKTRKQVLDHTINDHSPNTLFSHLRSIHAEEGWRGLTRGLVPRVAKVAPACAIMISSYELGKRLFHVT